MEEEAPEGKKNNDEETPDLQNRSRGRSRNTAGAPLTSSGPSVWSIPGAPSAGNGSRGTTPSSRTWRTASETTMTAG